MSKKQKALKALKALNNFSARGSKCPICKKEFRTGCQHSVTEAKNRLFQNYIKEIVK